MDQLLAQLTVSFKKKIFLFLDISISKEIKLNP